MRELHGVALLPLSDISSIKPHMLLVDKLHVLTPQEPGDPPEGAEADYRFIRSQGIIEQIDNDLFQNIFETAESQNFHIPDWDDPVYKHIDRNDVILRLCATALTSISQFETVPFCKDGMPEFIGTLSSTRPPQQEITLKVALHALPFPGNESNWQDIIDFKTEMRDKQWSFRRFLNTLATRSQTEAEIRDDIEWTLNEYNNAMKIHHLKSAPGAFEVYILPVMEVAEDLVKFNWSKIAKGALDVKKRQVELLEAEMKAPGRECAYVFDAWKRFSMRS